VRCATTSRALRGATPSSFFTAYAVFLSRHLARQTSSLNPVQLAVGALLLLRLRTARSLLRLDRRTYRREPGGRGVERQPRRGTRPAALAGGTSASKSTFRSSGPQNTRLKSSHITEQGRGGGGLGGLFFVKPYRLCDSVYRGDVSVCNV